VATGGGRAGLGGISHSLFEESALTTASPFSRVLVRRKKLSTFTRRLPKPPCLWLFAYPRGAVASPWRRLRCTGLRAGMPSQWFYIEMECWIGREGVKWRWRGSNPRPQWRSRQPLRPYPVGLAYGPAPPPPATGGRAGNPISRRDSGSECTASPVRLRYAAAPGPGSGLTGH
jgi:hypothetical protein